MRVAVTRAAPYAAASVLLEIGSSSRAEVGLTGDDLHIEMSPDGSA